LWISDNILDLNYFAFLSKEKEQVSRLVDEAKTNNVEYGIFRY
jgi:predicted PP-loop superfamily ATPase